MKLLNTFDPWKSKLCTCPQKYSFNPYTGCAHNCLYCYATYIPRFWELREKKDLFKRLERELNELPSDALISMSNSSDPYPPVERERGITRECLRIMKDFDVRVLIVTKSDLVLRDVDLLSEMRAAVSITITSRTAEKLEINAPSTESRIEALKKLKEVGIPTILRLDPLLPWASSNEWHKVLERCDFVDHVVTSTLKLKRDGYARIVRTFPQLRQTLEMLYLREGEQLGSYLYLNRKRRKEMLNIVANKCKELSLSYGFCREGVSFKAQSCDGSHLIR
jgi:DNA repair photolyase